MNAIKESKVATIRLIGVRLKTYSRIIDAMKCQMTINPVACIRLVILLISYCLFSEKRVLIARYLPSASVVNKNMVRNILEQNSISINFIASEAKLPNRLLNILVLVEKISAVEISCVCYCISEILRVLEIMEYQVQTISS
jgi:hypothetical protein